MSSADLASALPAHGAWLIPIVAMYLGYRIRMRIQKLRERIVEQKPTDDAVVLLEALRRPWPDLRRTRSPDLAETRTDGPAADGSATGTAEPH